MPEQAKIEYNADELVAPEWLNIEFCEKVLRASENDDTITAKTYKTSPASLKGDHYASIMFRVDVEYYSVNSGRMQRHLIVKTMPIAEGHKKDTLEDSHIFETEIGMYTEVLPKFQQMLRDIGDNTELAPRCLYYTLSPQKIIVLEDLCPEGFHLIRGRFFTTEELQAVLLNLAKFHALSFKLNYENPKYIDKYRYGVFSMSNMVNNDLFQGGVTKFLDMLDTVPSLHCYKNYFERIKDNLLSKLKSSAHEYHQNRQIDTFYVLNHGDFHERNMMFKHNTSGQYDDMRLVDFQLCWMSPSIYDVFYSMFMIWSKDQRLNNREELLMYYFTNFVETLNKLNHQGPMPKVEEFRQQLLDHSHFELFFLTTFLPMVYGLREGRCDLDKLVESMDYRKGFYSNPAYIKEVEEILPRYLKWGFFED